MENYKLKDIEAMMAYMKGKEYVNVEDMIRESGAEELRVYPIIAELSAKGVIEIVERDKMGAAITIRRLED